MEMLSEDEEDSYYTGRRRKKRGPDQVAEDVGNMVVKDGDPRPFDGSVACRVEE